MLRISPIVLNQMDEIIVQSAAASSVMRVQSKPQCHIPFYIDSTRSYFNELYGAVYSLADKHYQPTVYIDPLSYRTLSSTAEHALMLTSLVRDFKVVTTEHRVQSRWQKIFSKIKEIDFISSSLSEERLNAMIDVISLMGKIKNKQCSSSFIDFVFCLQPQTEQAIQDAKHYAELIGYASSSIIPMQCTFEACLPERPSSISLSNSFNGGSLPLSGVSPKRVERASSASLSSPLGSPPRAKGATPPPSPSNPKIGSSPRNPYKHTFLQTGAEFAKNGASPKVLAALTAEFVKADDGDSTEDAEDFDRDNANEVNVNRARQTSRKPKKKGCRLFGEPESQPLSQRTLSGSGSSYDTTLLSCSLPLTNSFSASSPPASLTSTSQPQVAAGCGSSASSDAEEERSMSEKDTGGKALKRSVDVIRKEKSKMESKRTRVHSPARK